MSARCLSTYAELETESYSAAARQRLADGRKIPPRLDFDRSRLPELRAQFATRMSISGVQEKLSVRLHRGRFDVVGEGGDYILKPIPRLELPRFAGEVPANESLTMQIAEQVYRLPTAANGLIRLADGELAYLVRRFDRLGNGQKVAQEDFCQFGERSRDTHGREYKYEGSYEEMGDLLRRICPAYAIESEKLFRLILFNYLVANGDAHLKNFSVSQTKAGDYVLSPAYDLLNTSLHIPADTRLALDLYKEDEIPADVLTYGYETGRDFLELARRFGLRPDRASRFLNETLAGLEDAIALTHRSFLTEDAKVTYESIVRDRALALSVR